MLESKDKEHVRTHIQDSLAAINTLRNLVSTAIKFEDFITLSLLADEGTLADIQGLASFSLGNLSDEKPEEILKWWHWAEIEYPDVEQFSNMAQDLADLLEQEHRKSVKEA